MIDRAKALQAVQQVLENIQKKQDLACPVLDENVRPLRDLERFDSPMSLAATGKIGRQLGIAIPPNLNLFGDSKGLYTIAKTVALLCEISETEAKPKEPADA